MNLQQQLATRLYELLPHKKELEFGCEVKDAYGRLHKIINKLEKGFILYVNDGIGSPIVEHPYYGIPPEDIIGQPLRLADLLMAIGKSKNGDITVQPSFRREIAHVFPQGISKKENDTRHYEYNLSKDNILDQSDNFCEFVLELLK